jgi:hypothetical protein
VERERFLFRAGSAGYAYPEILEVRRQSVRLLRPSGQGQRRQRTVSALITLGYIFGLGTLIAGLWGPLSAFTPAIAFAEVFIFFVGYFALIVWWNRRSLPLLAEEPAAAIPLEFFPLKSFGTFVEISAKAEGMELRVAVPGSRKKVEEALAFAGFSNPAPESGAS